MCPSFNLAKKNAALLLPWTKHCTYRQQLQRIDEEKTVVASITVTPIEHQARQQERCNMRSRNA